MRIVLTFENPRCTPKGPNLENFKILKFSSELEIFKRATRQTPIFCGEFWRSGLKISSEIEIFKRDWKFQAILIFFKIWALRIVLTFANPRICLNVPDLPCKDWEKWYTGKHVYLQLELLFLTVGLLLLCLQSIRCLLEPLSHCKQKGFNSGKEKHSPPVLALDKIGLRLRWQN